MADDTNANPAAALPELAEADAPPDIQAIYREISYFSGIPLPALIWRHLATHPGVLAEAWQAVRPVFAGGLVQEAAWRASRAALEGETSRLSRSRLRAAHLAPGVEAAYERVLEAYNRSNPVNFIAMRLLLAAMSPSPSPASALPAASATWVPPVPIDQLQPMTPVANIRVFERGQIDRLAADATIDRTRVVPSLYRHLVEWPALIRLIHNDLEPRMRSGEVRVLVDRLTGVLDVEARKLAPYVPPMPGLAAVPGLRETLSQFSGNLIPEMIVVGHLLRRGLDQAG